MTENDTVLTIDKQGYCEIISLNIRVLMLIGCGAFKKVEENSPVLGWGKRFDGLRDVWQIDGCKWSFVLPHGMSDPRELIAA